MGADRLVSSVVSVEVSRDAVREQLDRVLASEVFATAGRHRRLLQYVVDRTLANEGDKLKEYVVATEVFERPDTYDPRLDSIVRVEMRRLRSRLESYYQGVGAADPVIIRIPRGSYTPEFSTRPAPGSDQQFLPGDPPTRRWRPSVWAGVGALVAALVVVVWQLAPAGARPIGPPAGPGIAVLPFESYSSAVEDRLLAERLTDAVTAELAKLETVSVASRTSTSQYARENRRLDEIATGLGVHFVIEGSALVDGDRVSVVVRLVDAARDRKVWVSEYALTPPEIPNAAATIAVQAAAGAVAYRAARIAR